MNSFTRWLDSIGQDPHTAVRDALLYIGRLAMVMAIVLLPLMLIPLVLPASAPANPLAVPAGKTTPLPPYFVPAMAVFFVYMWFAVIGSIAFIGGWRRLAARFRAPAGYSDGQRFRMQSASIGGANYNNILTVR